MSSSSKKKKKLPAPVPWLEELGLEMIRMRADGNCLFRALAHQLYGNQEIHSIIRNKCCNYIALEREYFEYYLADRSFENYLNTMRQDKTWGGNLELQAFSEFYRKTVEVYTDNPIPQAHHIFGAAYSEAGGERPIQLFFRGRHYNSLLPCNVAELIFIEEDAGIYEEKQFKLYTELQNEKKAKADAKSEIHPSSEDSNIEKAKLESVKLYKIEQQRTQVRKQNEENLEKAIVMSLSEQ